MQLKFKSFFFLFLLERFCFFYDNQVNHLYECW
jgi:hypothetical protein